MKILGRSANDLTRRRHLIRWRRRGAGLGAVVSAAVCGPPFAVLSAAARGYRVHPVEAFVDASPPGPAAVLRVVLMVAAAVTAGLGLGRPGLGFAPPPAGTRMMAWIGGLTAAAACVGTVLAGLAARPLGALVLVLSMAVPLLLSSARLVLPVAALLAGLLAAVLGSGRTGLPLALDVTYAVAGAVLLGTTVFAVGQGSAYRSQVADDSEGNGAPDRVAGRLASIAVPAGVVVSIAGVGQLLVTGPRTRYDAVHTGYGLAAWAQAALPVLVTLVWLVARRPAGWRRAAELTRLAAGGLALAFAATAMLAT